MRSSLFGQLHYNYNNRLKKALQDHNNSKVSFYDEQILKAKYPEATCDIWHTPLLPENNIPNTEHHQPVTEKPVLVEDHELSAENNQTMFEHETVNVHVKVLSRLLKVFLLVTGVKVPRLKEQFELSILTYTIKEVKPIGFNYHDVKQNSQDWLNLRTGKVNCSIISNLIGLAGEEEHLHYSTCIKNNIDPQQSKAKEICQFC